VGPLIIKQLRRFFVAAFFYSKKQVKPAAGCIITKYEKVQTLKVLQAAVMAELIRHRTIKIFKIRLHVNLKVKCKILRGEL
jgi:hypothetical protein